MATGGPSSTIEGGDEVPAVAALEELPQLPDRVEYYTSAGQRRYIDIPIPDQVEYALPPGVQHVSREYMEECFRYAAGLTDVFKQQMTQRKRRASPLAPIGVRASATGRVSNDQATQMTTACDADPLKRIQGLRNGHGRSHCSGGRVDCLLKRLRTFLTKAF
ncbi:hypothetical protein RHSIM_Rhsim12G0012000 [Rhododendron simsii]|uniref:Uncharacterized protein n=1 Tax=Rhododendron simsii TaxID=118357 RepID=A0A834G8T6_RHOSS|nr:hypothetical protein RHSIM_Rhsim12G0012000 [Rhododendron simsii]